MKTIIASIVSLLLGLAIGCYIGHRDYDRHTTNEAVDLMVQGTETSEALQATIGARAIEFIGAGDTQEAVQLLSGPIARYYTLYSATGRNDERSTKLRDLIEQLARTNQVVAARITEISNMSLLKKP
jgi:hypothetical protein